jgi:hypothetical protein
MDPLTGMAVKGAATALSGTVKAVGSLFGGGKRRREQRQAKAEVGRMKEKYDQLDTSNPYANITNPYQNLTVNTQAADFAAQQNSQNSANIMSGLAAAAGGSGIAALAQSMANSQAQQTQQASASIAQQESKNQIMAAQGENQRQIAVAKGEESSRQMEADKVGTQLGMAQSRLTAANEARAAAKADLVGGLGDMMGGAAAAAVGTGAIDIGQFPTKDINNVD